jgi:hypothetical protein
MVSTSVNSTPQVVGAGVVGAEVRLRKALGRDALKLPLVGAGIAGVEEEAAQRSDRAGVMSRMRASSVIPARR